MTGLANSRIKETKEALECAIEEIKYLEDLQLQYTTLVATAVALEQWLYVTYGRQPDVYQVSKFRSVLQQMNPSEPLLSEKLDKLADEFNATLNTPAKLRQLADEARELEK